MAASQNPLLSPRRRLVARIPHLFCGTRMACPIAQACRAHGSEPNFHSGKTWLIQGCSWQAQPGALCQQSSYWRALACALRSRVLWMPPHNPGLIEKHIKSLLWLGHQGVERAWGSGFHPREKLAVRTASLQVHTTPTLPRGEYGQALWPSSGEASINWGPV